MKNVLSLLMIFVFLNSTLWAFPPNYGGNSGSSANLSGTYAGVMVPAGTTTVTAGEPTLGIFAIGIPGSTSGTVIAQGAGVVFVNGAGFNMTVTGVFDPIDNQLAAVLEGVSNFTFQQTVTTATGSTTTDFSIFLEGSMTGTVSAPSGNSTSAGSKSAAQISGTAVVDTIGQGGGSHQLQVSGFQESATYSVPTLSIANQTQGG